LTLQAECVQHGLRTIAFCHTRKLCELVTAYTRETLKSTAPHLADSMSVYRAGYSPQVLALLAWRMLLFAPCLTFPVSMYQARCRSGACGHMSLW
jgi:ATP-dependent helicase YprA (DUF1998 family)